MHNMAVANLRFFTGTMDSGKSTLAMQTDYNFTRVGRAGLVFTSHDRGGVARVTSRIGLESPAIEVTGEFDFYEYIAKHCQTAPLDYIVCDEAQFYSREQIDQLARVVDELEVEVYAYGITTDFRALLFPGSARLIELADRVEPLQLRTLCWCGERATHNARTVGGKMVRAGEQVVLGDTGDKGAEVAYVVLCRRHHRAGAVKSSD